jgi:hypothetical protein
MYCYTFLHAVTERVKFISISDRRIQDPLVAGPLFLRCLSRGF